MDLTEAVKQLLPLQLRLPYPHKPLTLDTRYAAEVFVVETVRGTAVVWIDPDWCDKPDEQTVHIAYATPVRQADTDRWVDNEPRYGPHCIPYQKPFVIERLNRSSPVWSEYKSWQLRRATKGKPCGRLAAWQRVEQELAGIVQRRLA